MTTPKDVQTAVNEVYRSSIIAILSENDEPLDNVHMNDLILGGSTEDQVKGAPEPFAAALLQLVQSGTVLALQVDDAEIGYRVVHKLASRGTEAEAAQSLVNVEENGPDSSFDADDPTTWPIITPTLELLDAMNAARSERTESIAAMISGIAQSVVSQGRDDSDQTVH